jgi:hypothetical protein
MLIFAHVFLVCPSSFNEAKKGCISTMCAFPAFPSTFQNLRLLEEVLYDLPPLEGVFLHWHTHGMTATTAGMNSLLARRKQLLGPTTLSGASIQLLYECATDSLRRLSLPWHGHSLSAAETQALLPPGVLVHKTVSLTLAETLLLCTSVGPQRVTRQQLHTIAAALALPRQAVKQCTINPVTSNPVETFAMQPGMVSPFLHPSHLTALGALVLLPMPERWEAQEQEVAISLSLWESLVLPLRCLRPLIRTYARRAYPGVRIIELESEETLYAQTEQSIG